jgi:hypothetical protein
VPDSLSPITRPPSENCEGSRAVKFGSGSGANTGGKVCFNATFLEKQGFKRFLTVLFIGRRKSAIIASPAHCAGDHSPSGARSGRILRGVPGQGKTGWFSAGKPGIGRCCEPGGAGRVSGRGSASPPLSPACFLIPPEQPVQHELGDPLGQVADGVETG